MDHRRSLRLSHYTNSAMHALLAATGYAHIAIHAPRASALFRDRRDGLRPHEVEMLALAKVM